MSEQKEAEAMDILSNAVSSSNLAHTLASVEGDRPLIYVNQAFLDTTGYSMDEVIGRNCRFLQGEDTDPEVVKKIKESLNKFEPIEVEILNYRKDGTPFLNLLKMSTVFDESGKPLAYMGIQSDVNLIVENVRIAQEKNKMESLGKLSANVSHEIKNALQPIRLMIEALQDVEQLSTEQIKKCITIAGENMDIAENIVKDVLRFSKTNNSNTEEVLVAELVSDLERFIKNLVPKTAHIESQIDDTLSSDEDYYVSVHRNGIYQIGTNIVRNALDVTNQKGEITFAASIAELKKGNEHTLPEGKYLSLSFSDNGDGITEDAMKNIFLPFFSTKSPADGTGLGLAISKKIAQDHDGEIYASDSKNGGAKFTVLIPTL